MPPLVAALLQQGLSILGGAVLAKGKEAVEEKLGIKLPDGDKPLDPAQVVELKKAEMQHEEWLIEAGIRREQIALETEKLAVENAAAINATMQAEAAAEHWPTYSWRPFIGFVFGAAFLIVCVLVCILAYQAVLGGKPEAIQMIPSLIAAFAALFAIPAPILGVASWFRGRMQADPNIPTVNRG